MATFKSTEYTNGTDGTGGKNQPSTKGKVWSKYAHFTGQALSSSDVVQVMTIPSGVRILPQSMVIISDLESSATVNVGYAAHTTQSSGAAVALDADAWISAVAADSARTVTSFHESGTHDAGYITTGELILTFALGAGTSLAADTFDFHVQYVGV